MDLPDGLLRRLAKQGVAAEVIEEVDPQTESRLRQIARAQGFDEDAFMREYKRLISEGCSGMDALSRAIQFPGHPGHPGHQAKRKPTLADFTPEKLEEPMPPQRPEPALRSKAKPVPEVKPKATSYAKLMELADGGDYLEIFAPAGHGKSRFLAHTALEAKRAGKRVLFLDSEHSIPRRIQKALGDSYRRLDFMNLDAIIDAVANLPKGLDLICYDSIGFPVLIKFVQMSLRERGDAIAKTILLRGHLKHYAEVNGALALGTNQPVSELYGMSHELKSPEERPPVGGKSIHVAKGVIRMDVGHHAENESTFGLRAFEMQDQPFNRLLAVFTISGEGERLEWKI